MGNLLAKIKVAVVQNYHVKLRDENPEVVVIYSK